jgi:hypothetical protein
MPTYRAITREVRMSAGFTLKTCWIAHVLELLGMCLRRAPNRIDPARRKYPCPPEKMSAIIAALYRLSKAPAVEPHVEAL